MKLRIPLSSKLKWCEKVKLAPGVKEARVSFEDEIPVGLVRSASASIQDLAGTAPPAVSVKSIDRSTVLLDVRGDGDAGEATCLVTTTADTAPNENYSYVVH